MNIREKLAILLAERYAPWKDVFYSQYVTEQDREVYRQLADKFLGLTDKEIEELKKSGSKLRVEFADHDNIPDEVSEENWVWCVPKDEVKR